MEQLRVIDIHGVKNGAGIYGDTLGRLVARFVR